MIIKNISLYVWNNAQVCAAKPKMVSSFGFNPLRPMHIHECEKKSRDIKNKN